MSNASASTLRRIGRYASTTTVFATLAGVGYWGHHTGWHAPKFSTLFGHSADDAKEDWCKAHNVPASKCIACHPELAGEDPKDWCSEHGVPESKCTKCHPELLTGGVALDWCKEHGVPESQCTTCHPELAVKSKLEPTPDDVVVTKDDSAADEARSMKCQTHLLRVQFASSEAVKRAGIGFATVQNHSMPASVHAPGEVEYDATRVARCTSRLPGVLVRVFAHVGDEVKKGDVIALLDATEVGRAKVDLLQAKASCAVKEAARDRMQQSVEKGLRGQTDLFTADAEAKEAHARLIAAHQALLNLGIAIDLDRARSLTDDALANELRLFGVPQRLVADLPAAATNQNLLAIFAPLGGRVISRDVVDGAVVGALDPVCILADTSQMWITVDARIEDLSRIAVGQRLTFFPDGTRDEPLEGAISWISTEADPVTRTIKARAVVPNPEGRLKARTFGSGEILIRNTTDATVIPDEAVNWEGCCWIVFVRLSDEIFQTRKIHIGTRRSGLTEIVAGLSPGEVVATKGSHVLKADVLRNRLGAG